MIKGINTGNAGGYLYIDSGGTSLPYIGSNSNNPLQGMLRLNNSNIEVFDGSSWMMIGGGYPSVSLSGSAISALDWASKKMQEETRIQELAKDNVTIADAWTKYQEAQDQLKVVLTLTDKS